MKKAALSRVLQILLASVAILASTQVTFAQGGDSPSTLPSWGDAGEQVEFEHLTIEQGLSNNGAPGIVQDDNGFMWFGTYDGLNRYDGYEFKVYRHDPEDPGSLSDNPIRVLYKDRAGDLWVGTWSGGLNRFDRETETFIRYRHAAKDPHSLSNDGIRSILEDQNGTLWIGTNGGGLNRLDRETGQFTHYKHDPEDSHSLGNDVIFALYEDRAGVLWVGTEGGGLNRFDPETETFLRYEHDPKDPNSISHNKVREMWEDRDGVFWVTTFGGGLNKFDRQTETFDHYRHDPADPNSLSTDVLVAILEDSEGILWVTSVVGVNALNRETDTFRRFPHDPGNPRSLSHDAVLTVYEDPSQILWFGTDNGGVNLLDREKKPFARFQHDPTDPNSLSNNDVYALDEDRSGILWIGTQGGGLNRYDPETGTFAHYRYDPADPNSLSHDQIYAVYVDGQDTVWVGTFGGGLERFDRETGTFVHYRHNSDNPRSLSDDAVMAIYEDRSGNFWIGTWSGGLNHLDRETGTFTHYRHDPADPNSLSSDSVLSMYEDQAGILWIGTANGGLNRFDREAGTFKHFLYDPHDPNSLSSASIWNIYGDPEGILWLATWGGGLNKFNPETEQFVHFTEEDGLPSDVICGIIEDDVSPAQGGPNLWISTTGGLSRFNPQTESFRNYDAGDGLQSDQFNFYAFEELGSGEMVFGGVGGFNTFYPEKIRDNSHVPPIAIAGLSLLNKPVPIGGDSVLQESIIESEQLTLSYQDRVFSLEFAALNYRSPDKNRYRYMLEGFDAEWYEVDSSRRLATYTNLDPGNYVFRVIGSNNDGIWNEEGAAISITVTPPWWETTWFRGSMAVLLVGLVAGAFVWQRKGSQRRERQLERQVSERTEELGIAMEEAERANQAKSTFLASMSHDLRTPLNGILGYAQILKRDSSSTAKQRHGLNVIEASGKYLLAVINDVLDLARVESGVIELYETDFNLRLTLMGVSEIIRVRAEQESLAFETQMDGLPERVHGDERRLRQVLVNLLDNAVKFTDKGSVILRVERTGGGNAVHIQFKVTDTGSGIRPENLEAIFDPFKQAGDHAQRTQGTGLGLAISRNLVELMGGELQVRSEVGVGSTFWFEVALPEVADETVHTAEAALQIVGIMDKVPKILIVDDNEENRAVLMDMLGPLGFDVAAASDGQEGLEKALDWRPAAIITDLVMPKMDGFELIGHVRQSPELQGIVAIATSASVYENDQIKSLDVGGDGFLPKPVEVDVLLAQLGRTLDLEWVYRDSEPGRDDEPTEVILPPADTLEMLFDLTAIGDVEELEAQLAELAQADEKYQPFAAKLQALARGFRLNSMRELLRGYLARDGEQ